MKRPQQRKRPKRQVKRKKQGKITFRKLGIKRKMLEVWEQQPHKRQMQQRPSRSEMRQVQQD